MYTLTISNDLANTHGHVVLTDGGVEIIEQRGKDPQTAARIALERLEEWKLRSIAHADGRPVKPYL